MPAELTPENTLHLRKIVELLEEVNQNQKIMLCLQEATTGVLKELHSKEDGSQDLLKHIKDNAIVLGG